MSEYDRGPKREELDTVRECEEMIHYLETFRVIAERHAADPEASEMCLQYAERIRNDLNHWRLRLFVARIASGDGQRLSF